VGEGPTILVAELLGDVVELGAPLLFLLATYCPGLGGGEQWPDKLMEVSILEELAVTFQELNELAASDVRYIGWLLHLLCTNHLEIQNTRHKIQNPR
jgi:hypothetical protein